MRWLSQRKASMSLGSVGGSAGIQTLMKTITLEEHFVTRDFLKATERFGRQFVDLQPKLLDLGQGRIAAMEEGGVDVQVLSLASMGLDGLDAAEQTAVMRGVHDELAAAVKAHPDRFAAFASPGLKEPEKAAQELERCVRELGFVGAMFDGTTDGKFLDDERFLPVLEAAVALDVPVYIHPAPPPEPVKQAYYSGLPGDAGFLMSIAGWGWHSETAIHVLRMTLAGVFERLPRLKVIIGHMGEGLPYALARTNAVFSSVTKGRRGVAETIAQQVWITTSGYFTRPPFDCCRQVMGMGRMMYSVDYPFSANTRGQQFLESLALEPEQKTMFAGGTAASVLKIERD